MNDIKYKVILENESPELATIEKSGIVVEIKLGDSINNFEHNKKVKANIESEVAIKKAIMSNVETNFPAVKDIDEKTQLAVYTYYEAFRFVKMAEVKLSQIAEAQENLETEIEEIKKQTGLEKISPEKVAEIMEELKEKAEEGEIK